LDAGCLPLLEFRTFQDKSDCFCITGSDHLAIGG